MRNIFDQYSQPENKLTHSLVSSLAQDSKLLKEFLRWSVGKNVPSREKISVIEQSLPGQSEINEKEADRRGLPDACIFDDNGWILIIESKVASRLSINQLKRHYDTVVRRGYKNPSLLVITTDGHFDDLPSYVKSKTWREVYEWGCRQFNHSPWPKLFTNYFEILEAHMVQDEYLKAGTLTKFTGIPFDTESPYSYPEAKRLLKLIIDEFKGNKGLVKELGIDTALPGRGAIKGVKGTVVWDFLRFDEARGTENFTEYPHLTFGILYEKVELMLTLPNRLNREMRERIFGMSFKQFINLIGSVSSGMKRATKLDQTVKPIIKILQRHYLSQSQPGIIDAYLSFDLRTIHIENKSPEKFQPEWIVTAFDVMRNKKSNMQMQIGIEVPLGRSDIVKTEKILRVFEEAARALIPILNVTFGRK